MRTELQCLPCQIVKEKECESFPPHSLILHSDESLPQACLCVYGSTRRKIKLLQWGVTASPNYMGSSSPSLLGFLLN